MLKQTRILKYPFHFFSFWISNFKVTPKYSQHVFLFKYGYHFLWSHTSQSVNNGQVQVNLRQHPMLWVFLSYSVLSLESILNSRKEQNFKQNQISSSEKKILNINPHVIASVLNLGNMNIIFRHIGIFIVSVAWSFLSVLLTVYEVVKDSYLFPNRIHNANNCTRVIYIYSHVQQTRVVSWLSN